MESPLVLLEVKNSRDSEETAASMEQVFASLGGGGSHGNILQKLFSRKHAEKFFSFEIVAVNSSIHFFVAMPPTIETYVESQLTAQYPKLVLTPVTDWAPHFLSLPHQGAQLVQSTYSFIPLRTHKEVRDLDMLAGILGQLAKLPAQHAAAIQIRISPAGSSWQQHAAAVIAHGIADPLNAGKTKSHPQARLIESKMSQIGFAAAIRLVAVASTSQDAGHLLQSLSGGFGVYALGEGNQLSLVEPGFWQKKKFEASIISRSADTAPRHQILNASELASLWHPPGLALSMIRNITTIQ